MGLKRLFTFIISLIFLCAGKDMTRLSHTHNMNVKKNISIMGQTQYLNVMVLVIEALMKRLN